jgi:hypothetical protein
MSRCRSDLRVERLEGRRLLSHLAHPHPHFIAVHAAHHVAIRHDHRRRHAARTPAVLVPSTPSSESTPPATSATAATPAISPPPAPAVTVIYPPPAGTSSQSGSA